MVLVYLIVLKLNFSNKCKRLFSILNPRNRVDEMLYLYCEGDKATRKGELRGNTMLKACCLNCRNTCSGEVDQRSHVKLLAIQGSWIHIEFHLKNFVLVTFYKYSFKIKVLWKTGSGIITKVSMN